jgi:hypothetical protein
VKYIAAFAFMLVLAGCGSQAVVTAPAPKASKVVAAQPVPAPSPKAAHHWVKVVTLKGNGGGIIYKSQRFKISGSQQRFSGVWYGDEVYGMASWDFVLVHKGSEGMSWPTDQGRFSEGKHLPAGTYYIFVNTANARWSVTLYDYR